MVMNVQKLVVLLIALSLTMRLLYLEVNSHIKNDAEKDSIYALIYWLMHINVIILYYGSYVLESNRVFSMPGDIGFVILFTLPMLLTLKDCVRRKK